jgi:uncharacterized protein YndB with AHSA1/START domain
MEQPKLFELSTPNDREVIIRRVFDAPCQLVFDAFTKPELLRRWYGGSGWRLEVCDIDLRVGGQWRFVLSLPEGRSIGQRGVYRAVVPPSRLVNTESWEDWDPGECLVTTEFVAQAAQTHLTSTIRFPSRDVRDIVLNGGLKTGTAASYEKLDQLLSAELPVR